MSQDVSSPRSRSSHRGSRWNKEDAAMKDPLKDRGRDENPTVGDLSLVFSTLLGEMQKIGGSLEQVRLDAVAAQQSAINANLTVAGMESKMERDLGDMAERLDQVHGNIEATVRAFIAEGIKETVTEIVKEELSKSHVLPTQSRWNRRGSGETRGHDTEAEGFDAEHRDDQYAMQHIKREICVSGFPRNTPYKDIKQTLQNLLKVSGLEAEAVFTPDVISSIGIIRFWNAEHKRSFTWWTRAEADLKLFKMVMLL